MSTSFTAAQTFKKGDIICALNGASWCIHNNCFHIPMLNISIENRCPSSFNAVYIGVYVDAVVAVHDIPLGSTIGINLSLLEYQWTMGDIPCTCGCARVFQGFSTLDETEKQSLTYLTEPNVRAAAYAKGYRIQSSARNDLVYTKENGTMGIALFASKPISKDTVLFRCGGLLVPRPTMYTIQVAKDIHCLFGDAAECIAHSCDPNMIVIPSVTPTHDDAFTFVTRRDIEQGELLGFNYQSSEWAMQQSFSCACKSDMCLGHIAGFSTVSKEGRERMWSYATNVMKQLVEEIEEDGKK